MEELLDALLAHIRVLRRAADDAYSEKGASLHALANEMERLVLENADEGGGAYHERAKLTAT